MAAIMARRGRPQANEDDDFVQMPPPDLGSKLIVRTPNGSVYKRICPADMLEGSRGVKVNCFCNLMAGVNAVRNILSERELGMFRRTAFGHFLDLGEIKWVNGQLLALLIMNYAEPVQGRRVCGSVAFHIRNRLLKFKKSDYALITGLRFVGQAAEIDDVSRGENGICAKYFNGSTTVTRDNVNAAFKKLGPWNARRGADGVKLALLQVLVNHMVGNQGCTKVPVLYLHLVDNLERFNAFPWGEHLWGEFVDNVYNCSVIMKSSDISRYTFPGFLFPLLIWAFETFPELETASVCMRRERSENVWPRSLRWASGVRPRHATLETAIFGEHEV